MNYNYENYLREKLNLINNGLEESERVKTIEVADEQVFAKNKTFDPETIYVVIKKLASSISYEAITQPVQCVVLCEQNSLAKTQNILKIFVDTYNWATDIQTVNNNTTYVKQQHSTPVVLSNFNEVGYGYRSVVYFTTTLYIMENVADVNRLYIDNVELKPLAFNITYSMTGNTQPIGNEKIASTVKNVATASIGMTIPLTETILVKKILEIMDGKTSGNTDFAFDFWIGNETGSTGKGHFSYNMKLISATINTAPNQVPSIQLGFMR